MSEDTDKNVLVGALLTPAMYEAFETARAESNNTDYVRGLIENDCVEKGIPWPGDMPQHGGNRMRSCPVCGGYKIIDPYGEWMCKDCGWDCTDHGYD